MPLTHCAARIDIEQFGRDIAHALGGFAFGARHWSPPSLCSGAFSARRLCSG